MTGIQPDFLGNTAVTWNLSPVNDLHLAPDSQSNASTTQWASLTTGLTPGTYVLTATSVNEPAVSAHWTFTVVSPVTSITPTTATILAGQSVPFSTLVLNAPNPAVSSYTDDANGYINMSSDTAGTYTHRPGTPGGQFHIQVSSAWGDGGAPVYATVNVLDLSVLPTSVIVPPGTSRQFVGRISGPQVPMQWTTTVPGATISANGLLSVPAGAAAGTYQVTFQAVQNPAWSASSSVTVATAIPVSGVEVAPATAVIGSGQQVPFSAIVLGQNGEPDPNQAVTWTVSGPASAVIPPSGLFTAPTVPGVYTVQATSQANPADSGTATVYVGEDLLVQPPSASLAPGASQPFVAQVTGLASPSVTWSVSEGAAGGSVSAAGLYTAPATAGVYHVMAAAVSGGETVTGIATVVVGATPQIAITLAPTEVQMTAGGTQQFTAAVTGTPDTAVLWSASAGTIEGVDASGLFTAPTSYGTVVVTATSHADGTIKAVATVVVSAATQGQAFQYDANGNVLSDGSRTFEWDAENRLLAVTVGTHRSEFGYDGLGRRVLITEKDNGTVTTSRHYVWVGDTMEEETDATAAPTGSPGSGGVFGGADCNQLFGWAFDATQPNVPIGVDIYDGATRIATVQASSYRGDLRAAGYGNGNHGFYFPTPASLKTNASHSVTVKLAGTSTSLGTRSVSCPLPSFAGAFGEADCTQLAGWAWDATQPNSALDVDIYDGSTLLATVLAGTFRGDLLNAGYGNGDHGFFVPTPASLKNGAAHAITIKISGTATVVGVTRTLTCTAPSFGGSFGSSDCTQLAGWAWDANQPNAAINVDIYDGANLLATVPAANFRQDLLNAGIGNGNHGFTFSSPTLYTGSTHTLTLKAGGTNTAIGGTRTLTCPVETILTSFFPGGMRTGPTNTYFSYDHLGSLREITDASGTVQSRYDYDPYGRLTINQGTPPRFGYGGHYYHAPSGLTLTQYRAYDPDLGRWESRDPLEGGHPYDYGLNDPENLIDPDGRNPAIAVPVVAAGAAAVVLLVAYEYWLHTPEGQDAVRNLPNLLPDLLPTLPSFPWMHLDPPLLPPFPLGNPATPRPIPMDPRSRKPGAPGRTCPPPTAIPGQRPRVTPAPGLIPTEWALPSIPTEDQRAKKIFDDASSAWPDYLQPPHGPLPHG